MISRATLYNLKREVKEENKQWFDMLAMSTYGYVEEYKELVETEKLALTKCWELLMIGIFSWREKYSDR